MVTNTANTFLWETNSTRLRQYRKPQLTQTLCPPSHKSRSPQRQCILQSDWGFTFTEHKAHAHLECQDTSLQTEQGVRKWTRDIYTNTSVHTAVTEIHPHVNITQQTGLLKLFKKKKNSYVESALHTLRTLVRTAVACVYSNTLSTYNYHV